MNRRRLLASGLAFAAAAPAFAQSPEDEFQGFLAAAEMKAANAGISALTIAAARERLAYNPGLVRVAGADPEARRVGRYVQSLLNGDGNKAKLKLAANPRLFDIEKSFGVPASVLVAFWGRESSYGADFGRLDVFSTLATMGVQRRGSTDWAAEYVAALQIVQSGARARADLKGSAAGPPLPPEGRAWLRGGAWIKPVTLPPAFDLSLIEVEETALDAAGWAALGIRPDEAWDEADRASPARLALPAGVSGPALLLLPNYDVFERYNPSRTYALGVGLLARMIDGKPSVAWPEEAPISLTERQLAQRALAAQGLYGGPIDGDLGSGSRRAVRRWQRSRGMAADGYLTTDIVRALNPPG